MGLLGVSREALAREGAVSAFVARAMVGGGCFRAGRERLCGGREDFWVWRRRATRGGGGARNERWQEEGEKIGLGRSH